MLHLLEVLIKIFKNDTNAQLIPPNPSLDIYFLRVFSNMSSFWGTMGLQKSGHLSLMNYFGFILLT